MPSADETVASKLQAEILGATIRSEDNLLIGSFAAELVGESYPFSKDMVDIVFKSYTDEALGRKFMTWIDTIETKKEET